MINVAIIGYGNIGRAAEQAVLVSPDMNLVGIFHHTEIEQVIAHHHEIDVALLCVPTREVETNAKRLLQVGISTVDSFDIHGNIWNLHESLCPVAKANKTISIIACGWDPGTDSVIRCLMQAMTPVDGVTYTNFGPGRSMGHSVVARSKQGVRDALSMTLPLGEGRHGRHVYVELEQGANLEQVRTDILSDDYFRFDPTEVEAVPSVKEIDTLMHGVKIERVGISGNTKEQQMAFTMRINNPALTGQVMTCAARATQRLCPGAYVLPEVPPMWLLSGTDEDNIRHLV